MRKYWLLPLLLLASCGKTEPIPQSKSEGAESASVSSLPPLPSDDHERIPLYQKGNVPYDGGNGEKYAFLTPYLASNPSGGAVIVLPGGGYTHLSNSTPEEGSRYGGSNNDGDPKEAAAIAPYYNQAGISVFVLNYRTTVIDPSLDYHGLLADVLRAVRLVSSLSGEYRFDHLAVQGFSAGGHLALMAHEEKGFVIDDPSYEKDDIDELPIEIDSLILGYPVVSFLDGLTHASTRKTFTGNDPSLYETFSAELHVDEDFPSTYLFHEKKDPTVSIQGSERLDAELTFFDIDHRYDRFADEASDDAPLHGFGVNEGLAEAKAWMQTATSFLKERSF